MFLGSLESDLAQRAERWQQRDGTRRLLAKDAELFSGADESRWLGWLRPTAAVDGLAAFRESLSAGDLVGIETVVLLGMGGSSLGSEVVFQTLQSQAQRRLVVLDTTNPESVGSTLDTIDPATTLVIAASKSGSTLETAVLLELFWERFSRSLGEGCGAHFVAITDPGSAFEERARGDGFGHVFLGDREIGGRFSVLSPFGLVPAAALGIDPETLIAPALEVLESALDDAVRLGLVLAAAHESGRNKVTLRTSSGLGSFGTWLEQLLAESTGKGGVGLVPVDGEPATELGDDRLLVRLAIAGEPIEDDAEGVEEPRVEIELPEASALGAELYRWQIATAVVGAELGLNPFDQPDVEAAKVVTRRLVEQLDAPAEPPRDPPVHLLSATTGDDLASAFAGLLEETSENGTYLAILAYLPMSPIARGTLRSLRSLVIEQRSWATCSGFGPRYLHSTGQVHKGGPPQGRFLALSAASAEDRAIPGRTATLAQVHNSQALGDVEVLSQRQRPVAHVELRGPLEAALEELRRQFRRGLG
ncbi:MAG: hypothetical protein AAGA81_19175 [Acidobacteriota bacterium]